MDSTLENTLDNIYSYVIEKQNQILNIFNGFFGEHRVDMQGIISKEKFKSTYKNLIIEFLKNKEIESDVADKIKAGIDHANILIHFPSVTISNEYNKTTIIKDLYVKIQISIHGKLVGKFSLNRATYSRIHWISNYLHSHVAAIPKHDTEIFQNPCTGYGPINNTISNLNVCFDENLWKLFCVELTKFVETESVEGGPYHKIENIGVFDAHKLPSSFNSTSKCLPISYRNTIACELIVESFVEYFIAQKKLKFNFINGNYFIGMPYIKYMIILTNSFIDWYNNQYNIGTYGETLDILYNYDLIKNCVIRNNNIYTNRQSHQPTDYVSYIGKKVCTFKGEDVRINILNTDKEKDVIYVSNILNMYVIKSITIAIISIINYKYGRNETKNASGDYKKTRYL